jgi:hypothetical protein
VTFSTTSATLSPINRTTIFTPQIVDGVNYPNAVLPTQVVCNPSNGVVNTNLLPGFYTVSFVGWPRTMHVFVPDLWVTNLPPPFNALPVNLALPNWQVSGGQLLFVATNFIVFSNTITANEVTNFFYYTNFVSITNNISGAGAAVTAGFATNAGAVNGGTVSSVQPFFRLTGSLGGSGPVTNFDSIVSPNGTNWYADSVSPLAVQGVPGTNSAMYDPCWMVISNQYLLCWNGASSTNGGQEAGGGIGVASSLDGINFTFIGYIVPTNNIVSPPALASANWGPHWVVDATNGLHIVYWCPTNNQPSTLNANSNGDWIVDVQPFTTNAWNARFIALADPVRGGVCDNTDPSIRYVNGVYYLLNSTYLYTSFAIDSGYVTNGYLNGNPLYLSGVEGEQMFQQPGGLWIMIGTQSRQSFEHFYTSPDLTNWTTGGTMTGPWHGSSGNQGTVIQTFWPPNSLTPPGVSANLQGYFTGFVFIPTNSVLAAPNGQPYGGWLWNSNNALFWVTSAHTNYISGP